MVIILKNASGLKTKTFKEWFQKSQVLPCSMVENWDDVVDNITNAELRRDTIMNGCLFGVEYPPDTPITGGRKSE